MNSSTVNRKNRSVSTPRVPDSSETTKSTSRPGSARRPGIDLVLLDPEAAQRGAGVQDGVVHLVGVRREQVGQPSHGNDEGEGEEHQHQVGDQQHEARYGPPREAGPLQPPADRVQRHREDHGQEDRPDDVADGPRPGQRDREGSHPDQQCRGEGTFPVDDPWCRTWRVGHLGLPWQLEQATPCKSCAGPCESPASCEDPRATGAPGPGCASSGVTCHRVMSRPWAASAQMTKTSSVMIGQRPERVVRDEGEVRERAQEGQDDADDPAPGLARHHREAGRTAPAARRSGGSSPTLVASNCNM